MKKLISKFTTLILSSLLVFTSMGISFADEKNDNKSIYEVEVGNSLVEVKEGEKIELPLVEINNSNSEISTYENFPGNAGVLALWANKGKVYYRITMTRPATSFRGQMGIANLTDGSRGSYTSVSGFSGSVSYYRKKGHRYRASMDGTAYLYGSPVARVVSNGIVFTD